jgi:hypothetical protein
MAAAVVAVVIDLARDVRAYGRVGHRLIRGMLGTQRVLLYRSTCTLQMTRSAFLRTNVPKLAQ